MKRYLLDTNILMLYIRQDTRFDYVNKSYQVFPTNATSLISVVTHGELKAISLKRQWGFNKVQLLEATLSNFLKADISVNEIIERYAEIDTYSEGKLPSKPLSTSARKMGKNDLWIAATASVLGLTLLTTDKDFDHLKDVYLDLAYVDLNTIPK